MYHQKKFPGDPFFPWWSSLIINDIEQRSVHKKIISLSILTVQSLIWGIFFSLSLCFLFIAKTHAQQPQTDLAGSDGGKSVKIPILDVNIRIDGTINESAWDEATPIADFHQYLPAEYVEPTQPTEVRIFYTNEALYIAARLWDSNPELIIDNVLRQGQRLGSDDVFAIILDPYLDRRNGYRFEVNANGVRWEGLFQNITEIQSSWDGIWQAAAAKDDQGWTAEIRIPFQTISFSPGSDSWGINFNRTIKRNGESIAWVSRNRQVNPSIAGTITGLTGMRQGLGFDIVPSLVVRNEKIFGPVGFTEEAFEPQVDIYYKITTQLNASLTINTDFSATEVDNRQVNLTRFNLFFPEKREFFIRDSDIFEFGQIGLGSLQGASGNSSMPAPAAQNARPFFSRRIGLSPTGTPIDINAGTKLSGRVGNWNVGTLFVSQKDDPSIGLDSSNIFVGRASLNVLGESQIGVIATDGDPQSNLDSSLVGADFRFRNSHLPGGKTVEASAFYQQTDTEGKRGDDASYGLIINYPNNQGLRGAYRYKQVGENFDPAVGFVSLTGMEDHGVDVSYSHFLPPGGFIRSVTGYIEAYRSISLGDQNVISEVKTARFAFQSITNDLLYGRVVRNRELLRKNFTIYRSSDQSRSVVIPAGDYIFTDYILGLIWGGQREISGRIDARRGEYFDGDRSRIQITTNWKPIPNLDFGLVYTENAIELPYGNFTTRLFSMKAQVAFSSKLSWANLVQYDNVSETMGINSRLHWIPKAGQQAFLVLNYGFQDFDKDDVFESTNADLSLKFNYTFRF